MASSKGKDSDRDVEIIEKFSPYRGYFRLDRYSLRHRMHDGGWTKPLMREVFEHGHTVAVLPYDPLTDAVVLIEQFRIGAYAAGLAPWLTEVVAGTIEELVAAGCKVSELEHIGTILLNPGAISETTAMYCGRVDSQGVGGVHGLSHEGEDILVSVVPADEAIAHVAGRHAALRSPVRRSEKGVAVGHR